MLILPPSDAQSHGPGPWQLNWILLLAGVDTVTFWSVALTWTITRPCNFTKARKRPKPAASLQGFINLGRLVYFRGLGDIREARDLAVASGPYRGPQGVTLDRENKCGGNSGSRAWTTTLQGMPISDSSASFFQFCPSTSNLDSGTETKSALKSRRAEELKAPCPTAQEDGASLPALCDDDHRHDRHGHGTDNSIRAAQRVYFGLPAHYHHDQLPKHAHNNHCPRI